MSGNLRPGDFIRQERIADELELSATPVREGLLSLRGEGFVELKPRRGFVVAPLSASDVRDLFTAQALLAGELVSRAAVRMGPDDLRALTEVHEALLKAAADGDGDLVESLNHDFHRRINRAADAPQAGLDALDLDEVRAAPVLRDDPRLVQGLRAGSCRDHQGDHRPATPTRRAPR